MAPPRTVTLPTQEELNALLHYNAETGVLTWRKRPDQPGWSTRWAGKEAFTYVKDGHRRGLLFHNSVYAHRVIWKMMTGEDPSEIDHIDGNGQNNAWRNLRVAVAGANQKNTRIRSDNKTGHVGIVKRGERYIAQGGHNGTTVHIGVYSDIGLAIAARRQWQAEHGFHPDHGRDPDRGIHYVEMKKDMKRKGKGKGKGKGC